MPRSCPPEFRRRVLVWWPPAARSPRWRRSLVSASRPSTSGAASTSSTPDRCLVFPLTSRPNSLRPANGSRSWRPSSPSTTALELLMRRAGLHGLPGNRTRRPKPATPSVADLVNRDFTRHARDQSWITLPGQHRPPPPDTRRKLRPMPPCTVTSERAPGIWSRQSYRAQSAFTSAAAETAASASRRVRVRPAAAESKGEESGGCRHDRRFHGNKRVEARQQVRGRGGEDAQQRGCRW